MCHLVSFPIPKTLEEVVRYFRALHQIAYLNARLDVHVGHLAVTQLIVDVQLGRSVAMHEILLSMHLTQVMHRTDRAAATLEGLAKGRAKFAVEVSVDNRIQGAVEIAYPEHSCHY